ncbi:MAG TPA: Fic family protein [Thermoanaerobaculia bacterium]|jgi:Fic family protein|nr:Fic family protein [Thermoanaerobaculia bacterium]
MPAWIWEQTDWPAFRWREAEVSPVLARARLAQGRILGAAGMLDPALTLDADVSILIEDGVQTSAIEGERLDLGAVRSSVARHLGLPTAGLPAPSRAIDGLIDVLLDATRRFDTPLTLERLLGWQAALFPTGYSGLRAIRSGQLRGTEPMEVVSGGVGREHVHFLAPPRERLQAELARFLGWFEEPSKNLDGLVLAGIAHLWFITLHPFEDGNGRLARAVTDMAIARDERRPMRLFSLSAQIQRRRNAYYKILERTQRGDLDITPWLVWFLEQVEDAATQAHSIIARTLGKARFWLRFQAVEMNERQRKVLNRLLDAGLQGFAGGINNRKYMGLTRTSRATAWRELSDLVAKGCLVPTGKGGRSSAYEIPWAELA